MILFRCAPSGLPFLWERGDVQPGGRWHADGQGPVQYLADTADGAWAEVLRHFEITDERDLAGLRHTVWAVEVPDDAGLAEPDLTRRAMTGGAETYEECRREAARLRARGAAGLRAPSAALEDGEARGWRVDSGMQPARERDGRVVVLFGRRPDLVAWRASVAGQPDPALLRKVRRLRRST